MNFNTVQITYKGRVFKISVNYRKVTNEHIVFIHGWGCTKECFDNAFSSFKLKDFSLLSFDLLGHGDSSKPLNFPYRMEDHAAICKSLLNKLKIKSPHIVAHSMGGSVGLLLAKQIDYKIKSFCNLEGNLISEDCYWSREVADMPLDTFIERPFSSVKSRIARSKDKGLSIWLKMLKKVNPTAFYLSAKSLVKWSDSSKLLQNFIEMNVKKSYFYGSINSSMYVLNKMSDIQKIKISNSGHFVMNDNPKELYHKLNRFITKP